MQLLDLIKKNRSYRRFYQDVRISEDQLISFVNCARLSASARNIQALKFVLSTKEELNAQIFSNLAWAGYIPDWAGPEKGEQPSAYIVLVKDNSIATTIFCDEGIAAQSILLAATEQGFGGCMIASFKKKNLHSVLKLDEKLEIVLVIALGKPKEEVVLREIEPEESIKYYRDENRVHYVPKRKLPEIVIIK